MNGCIDFGSYKTKTRQETQASIYEMVFGMESERDVVAWLRLLGRRRRRTNQVSELQETFE